MPLYSPSVTAFTGLSDVPASYSGAGNKVVSVNAGATALEFTTPSAGGGFVPTIQTGRYYSGITPFKLQAGGGSAEAAGGLPVLFPMETTWNRIGINVNTGAEFAAVRLGVYSAGADGLPDAPLLDSGELDASASGDLEATINITLDANTLYWLAAIWNAAGEVFVRAVVSSNELAGWIEFNYGRGSSLDTAKLGFEDFTASYGALPDPMPSPNWNANPLYIWLRKV